MPKYLTISDDLRIVTGEGCRFRSRSGEDLSALNPQSGTDGWTPHSASCYERLGQRRNTDAAVLADLIEVRLARSSIAAKQFRDGNTQCVRKLSDVPQRDIPKRALDAAHVGSM
jgi:hypothetical protein